MPDFVREIRAEIGQINGVTSLLCNCPSLSRAWRWRRPSRWLGLLMRLPADGLGLALIVSLWLGMSAPTRAASPDRHGAVATVHPLATEAGAQALKRGGNAIDAAIAVALTLGVVDAQNSGLGGGCFLLVRLANGDIFAIDGRETAPAAASRDMFVRERRAVPELSQTGPLAVAVPGALAAYEYAASRFGKLPLGNHLLRAAKVAEQGFAVSSAYAAGLREAAGGLRQFPASRKAFLRRDGQPWNAGDALRQPDLAASYRAIAAQGSRWFYHGPFAQACAAWMRDHGGVLTESDFAKYEIKLREPIRTTYRGYEVIGFPPPSSGGVHVAQILNLLENFDLQRLGPNSADFIHLTAEAMKMAFADRAFWLGDPDFVRVPRWLVSKAYAARLAKQIRLDRVANVVSHDTPEQATTDVFGGHTTHFSIADGAGNWVACTTTINTAFGSKVVVPNTGIVLNNEMDDFSAQPGATNYFGLVGAEANAVAPGKRPLSSMSPTIVLKDGKPVLAVGAAGGPTIISQTVLAIVKRLDFGMGLAAALAQPRFHHQWRPDELQIEKRIELFKVADLERRGHKVKIVKSIGPTQAVAQQTNGRGLTAAHDPRVKGKAVAW